MRTSILGAAFLLAGASAATLAAATGQDTNGNGLALNGSDTLFDVTTAIVNGCATQFSAHGNTMSPYQGGGSGVGAGAMDSGNQAVSPMSTALSSAQYCTQGGNATAYGTNAADPTKSEGLLVGIDGVAIVANQTNSCSSAGNPVNGFAAASMTVDGNPYTFGDSSVSTNLFKGQPAFDALAVLYLGLTHDGQYNCASDARKTLISSWANLFSTSCAGGNGTCSAGLTHAWRRSDLSGTTDAFLKILNPPNGSGANGKASGTSVGIGSLSTITGPGSGPKSNPFCNSTDATTSTNTTTATSFGGSSDLSDKDPIRTACAANGTNDEVCQPFFAVNPTDNQGDLGVVLPILIPDSSVATPTDIFPTLNCGASCTLVAVGPVGGAFRCPGTTSKPVAGACYMPFKASGGVNDPRCTSSFAAKCIGANGNPDGRFYNLSTVVSAAQFTASTNPSINGLVGNKPFQISVDANLRLLTGSFFRIHHKKAGVNNVPDPTGAGTTGLCAENDDTSQIGCLSDSDPCSIGYAGREAAKGYPGIGTPAVPTSQPLKALSINGTPPFNPSGDPDLFLKNLLTGGTPLYPFSRRLYFATIFGFGNSLQGAEKDLAACYGTDATTSPIVASHGFVAIPGGVSCVDYPEQLNTTATPAPNKPGSGNTAFGGCAGGAGTTIGSGVDACTATATKPVDINGNTVQEAVETYSVSAVNP